VDKSGGPGPGTKHPGLSMLEQWSNIGRHHGKISRSAKTQSGQFCATATGIKRSLKNIKTEVFFGGGRSARAIGQTDQTPEKSRSNRLVFRLC